MAEPRTFYRPIVCNETLKVATGLTPIASDGSALGSASLPFSDLFLASGAVINFNNGDVTLTHSTDALTLASSSAVATATDVRAFDSGLTVTGASAVNQIEAFRSVLNADVQTGNWANALVGKIDFKTSGYVTGLAAAICAELDMPGGAIPGGNGTYAAVDCEIICPASFVSGGVPMTFLNFSASGSTVGDFDDNGYLFVLSGVTSGSAHVWYDNQKSAPAVEEFIRVKTPAGVRFIGLYNANA